MFSICRVWCTVTVYKYPENKRHHDGFSNFNLSIFTCHSTACQNKCDVDFHRVDYLKWLLNFCSAGKVCRLWKDVSLRPHLWKNVDFGKAAGYGWKCPTTKSGFTGFLRKRCGSCKKLNVSNCCQMAKTWAVQVLTKLALFYSCDIVTNVSH